jgi:lysophospholipase L1-like esterase
MPAKAYSNGWSKGLKKVRDFFLILLFNIVMIAGILYGFEFLFSPFRRLPQNGIFNGKQYTWGHLVENNRYGFRERDFETPKPAEVFRIMVLGDSFTWGEGLAVEERYTNIAEGLLNNASLGIHFEVLNFGVRGASTEQERRLLRNYLKVVQPDLIVVGFGLNDTQNNEMDYSIEREQLDARGGKYVREFTHSLYNIGLPFIAESLRGAFYGMYERRGVIPSWEIALGRTYDPSSDDWKTFLHALAAIKQMSDFNELPEPIFAVLNQGSSTTQPTDYGHPDKSLQQYLKWYHQAEQAAGDAGYLVYNHEQEIATQLNHEPLSINFMDAHPSAHLNRIYGEKLYHTIVDSLKPNP